MKPSFSVVIPTYNRSALVGRALASIEQAADGLPHEVIVVDDASDDLSALQTVLGEFASARLITKERRANAAHSRRLGFEAAAADFVFFLDSDDAYAPGHVLHRLQMMAAEPASIVFGNYDVVRAGVSRTIHLARYAGGDMRDYLFGHGGSVMSSTISINKRHWRGTMFNERWQKHQDWAFAIDAFDAGEAIGFDDRNGVAIHQDDPAKMSSRTNIAASTLFCDSFLRANPAYRNRFVLGQMVSCFSSGDPRGFRAFRSLLARGELPVRSRAGLWLADKALALGLAAPITRLVRFWRAKRGPVA